MDLNLVQLLFRVETKIASGLDATLFDGLRHFNQIFRQVCCQSGVGKCLTCEHVSGCPYRSVFAQELSTDPDVVRRHQKPPLPFAFKIRSLSNDNSFIDLSLVVVGSAVNHLPVFYRAVQRLIEALPDQFPGTVPVITGIDCLDYQSVRHKLDCSLGIDQDLIVLSSLEIIKNTVDTENLRLTLESPLRLISAGSILHYMDFAAFLRSQLRRCSSLFAYYGDGELEIDFAGLSAAASQVKCINDRIRYSQPSWSQRSNHAGLLGLSEFVKIAPGILPLLILGSYFNAGKGASSGLGAYLVETW